MENDVKKLEKSVFNTLYEIDTRERAVVKDTGKSKLNYLPWATVYSEVCKHYDDVQYEFMRDKIEHETVTTRKIDENITVTESAKYVEELPYFNTGVGIEVRTAVTINGVRKEMQLPVYDSSYNSMGLEAYTYSTKFGEKEIKAANYGDIYKSIMRCFAKNLSMWGVGLNLWTKEDATEWILQLDKQQAECMELIKKKCALSENTKAKVNEICVKMLPDSNGDPRLCEDNDVLKELIVELKKVRKIA